MIKENKNWQLIEDKNRKRGLVSTVLFHAFLFIVLLFAGWNYPYPPPPEEGVYINFGSMPESASEAPPERQGERPPQETVDDAQPEATESQTEAVQPVETEVATQDHTETIAMQPDEEETPEEEEVVETTPEPEPDPELAFDPTRLNWGSPDATDPNGQNPREGGDRADAQADRGSGDQGIQFIDGGDGFSYSLGNRSLGETPNLTARSREGGQVTINIVVDRQGKVISATRSQRGTTTTNPQLIRLAIDAAYQVTFNPDPNAPDEQRGTLRIDFRLN
ncbi:MAG: TonB family protein [Chitinophagaceae bacterium]|nr:MAG: TonB family protein [Chitinophagaceae bacterium]